MDGDGMTVNESLAEAGLLDAVERVKALGGDPVLLMKLNGAIQVMVSRRGRYAGPMGPLLKALDRFHREMEARLTEKLNDGEDGWDDQDDGGEWLIKTALKRLEAVVALMDGRPSTRGAEDYIERVLVDVANFAMMAHHTVQKGRKA